MSQKVAVIMGGYSSEVPISLKSGSVVMEVLKSTEYTPFAIHILKDRWVHIDDYGSETSLNKDDFSVTLNNSKINFF